MTPGLRNNLAIYDEYADRRWSDEIRWVRTLKNMVPGRLRYFDQFTDWAGQTVLDLGCAGGFMAEALQERGALVQGSDPAQDAIAAARRHAAAEGRDISGPWPGDTLFHAAARARYDVAVAMYHDQALIPIKTLDFDRGVNVTLGLPIVRTSPDHGTAFDIAGKGVADATSMIEAIKLGARMAKARAGG